MRFIRGLLFLSLSLLLVSLSRPIQSQDNNRFDTRLRPDQFNVDYAYFKLDEEGMIRLELYYRLYNSALQFVGSGDRYVARYEVAVLIYDNKGRQVTAFTKDKKIELFSYESTVSQNDYRISQIDHELPPGKYKVNMVLTDKNSEGKLSLELPVTLPEYDSRFPQFSGIEFVTMVDTAVIDSVFRKGNISIIPSANRRFTGDTSAGLLYYFELYQGSKKVEEALIETRILDQKLSEVYEDTIRISFEDDSSIVRQLRRISLKEVKSGDYTLEMSVKGKRNRDMNRIRESFLLYWPPDKMILHDHETAIKMLKYIADPEVTKELRAAETPDERLRQFREFWKTLDPSPGTEANETKADYYNRIEYANRAFSIMKKEGWLTDFGMIYIQYGRPDQIEDFPFELSTKAYQIWYYYHLDQPRKFVFVDEWNDGDYRLQYPYDGRSW